jgi:hypothetical protein
MGIQNGAVLMQNSVEFPNIIKIKLLNLSKRIKTKSQRKITISVHCTTNQVTKMQKQPKSTDDWIKKMIHY